MATDIAGRDGPECSQAHARLGSRPDWTTGTAGTPIEILGGPMANVPNAITLVRTVCAVILAIMAISRTDLTLAVVAYAVYWSGDILDGLLARWLRQETRVGAVFDIIADRACCSLCISPLLALKPQMALPAMVFLVEFLVVDCLLSMTFLRWPILSPNYFYLVHRPLYLANWSPPAKAFNSSALVILMGATSNPWFPTALAVTVTVVKLVSLVVAYRLPAAPPPVTSSEGRTALRCWELS